MFKIQQIETANFYMDKAMDGMQEFAQKVRPQIDQRFEKSTKTRDKTPIEINLNKRKDLELEKIRFLNDKLNTQLKKIIKTYPKMNKLEDVYKKLINTSDIKVKDIEDSLRRLLWITNTVDEFTQNTEVKIKRAKTGQTVGFLMKKHLGRVNSLFRKNKSYFTKLEQARKFMNKLPTFLDIYTVAIGGYPNVGKSTLMQKVTGSDVEVQNYPFTTKGLMFGYIEKDNHKQIQLIDTPGLLGRDKNNDIEQRAEIILSEYSDVIIFVLDFTESCGYGVKNQIKLLKKTNDLGKKIVLYLSKTDIYDEEAQERQEEYTRQIKKYQTFTESEELKTFIIAQKEKNKKFDIRNIKVIK